MSFIDGKQRIATKEDIEFPWGGNTDNFRCGFCGKKIKVGDTWRYVITNCSKLKGVHGNSFVCGDCDDSNDNLIRKLAENYQEFMSGKFWRFRNIIENENK